MTRSPDSAPRRQVELTIDGQSVTVPEGSTLLTACSAAGVQTPTLCYLETLTPVNVCRVCVVEVDGSRTLVPACSRQVEAGMVVRSDSERVRHSRRMVLELLASSVDMSQASADVARWMTDYGVDAQRYGPPAPPAPPAPVAPPPPAPPPAPPAPPGQALGPPLVLAAVSTNAPVPLGQRPYVVSA